MPGGSEAADFHKLALSAGPVADSGCVTFDTDGNESDTLEIRGHECALFEK